MAMKRTSDLRIYFKIETVSWNMIGYRMRPRSVWQRQVISHCSTNFCCMIVLMVRHRCRICMRSRVSIIDVKCEASEVQGRLQQYGWNGGLGITLDKA